MICITPYFILTKNFISYCSNSYCAVVQEHQMVDTLALFQLRRLQQNPSILHHLHSVPLLLTGNSDNCLHSANIIWEKYSKKDQVKFVEDSL